MDKQCLGWAQSLQNKNTISLPSNKLITTIPRHYLLVIDSFQLLQQFVKTAVSTLQTSLSEEYEISFSISLSLFDSVSRQFFGTTKQTPHCKTRATSSSVLLKGFMGEILYMSSSIIDPDVICIAEIVGVVIGSSSHRVIGKIGLGWTYFPMFAMSPTKDLSEECREQSDVVAWLAGPTELPIYSGSPRALLFSDRNRWPDYLRPISQSCLAINIFYNRKLKNMGKLIPENIFLAYSDNIPGLRMKSDASGRVYCNMRCQRLRHAGFGDSRTTALSSTALVIESDPVDVDTESHRSRLASKIPKRISLARFHTLKFSDFIIQLPNDYEEELLTYIWNSQCLQAEHISTIGVPDKRVRIASRTLKIGIHNGWKMIGKNSSTGQAGWTLVQMNKVDKAPALIHDGTVAVRNYVEHFGVAILFELEYVVSVPVLHDAKAPPQTITVTAGFSLHAPITKDRFILENINEDYSATRRPLEKQLTSAPELAFSDSIPFRYKPNLLEGARPSGLDKGKTPRGLEVPAILLGCRFDAPSIDLSKYQLKREKLVESQGLRRSQVRMFDEAAPIAMDKGDMSEGDVDEEFEEVESFPTAVGGAHADGDAISDSDGDSLSSPDSLAAESKTDILALLPASPDSPLVPRAAAGVSISTPVAKPEYPLYEDLRMYEVITWNAMCETTTISAPLAMPLLRQPRAVQATLVREGYASHVLQTDSGLPREHSPMESSRPGHTFTFNMASWRQASSSNLTRPISILIKFLFFSFPPTVSSALTLFPASHGSTRVDARHSALDMVYLLRDSSAAGQAGSWGNTFNLEIASDTVESESLHHYLNHKSLAIEVWDATTQILIGSSSMKLKQFVCHSPGSREAALELPIVSTSEFGVIDVFPTAMPPGTVAGFLTLLVKHDAHVLYRDLGGTHHLASSKDVRRAIEPRRIASAGTLLDSTLSIRDSYEARLQAVKASRSAEKPRIACQTAQTNVLTKIHIKLISGMPSWFEFPVTNPFNHKETFRIEIEEVTGRIQLVTDSKLLRHLKRFLLPSWGCSGPLLSSTHLLSISTEGLIHLLPGESVSIPFRIMETFPHALSPSSIKHAVQVSCVKVTCELKNHLASVIEVHSSLLHDSCIIDRTVYVTAEVPHEVNSRKIINVHNLKAWSLEGSHDYRIIRPPITDMNEPLSMSEWRVVSSLPEISAACAVPSPPETFSYHKDNRNSVAADSMQIILKFVINPLEYADLSSSEALLYIYRDSQLCILHEVWRLIITPVYPLTLQHLSLFEPPRPLSFTLPLLSSATINAVRVFSSNKRLLSVSAKEVPVSTVSTVSKGDATLAWRGPRREFNMDVTVYPGNLASLHDKPLVLKAIDAITGRLAGTYVITTNFTSPHSLASPLPPSTETPVSVENLSMRVFDVSLPLGNVKHHKLKIKFNNRTKDTKLFRFHTLDMPFVKLNQSSLILKPSTYRFLHLAFHCMAGPTSKDVIVYVTNEQHKQIEHIVFKVIWDTKAVLDAVF